MLVAENFFTTREAAKFLGVSVRTIQLWVDKGYLDGWKTSGGHRRISRESIERVASRSRSREAKIPTRRSLPILIVEDDPVLLKLYRLNISAWPFHTTIHTAPNGYEGLVMIGEASPSLLICDLRLPGVNGFQIIRAIRNIERYHHLAIVVVSGMPLEEIDAYGGVPDDIDLMGKPVDFRRLQGIAQALWSQIDYRQADIRGG